MERCPVKILLVGLDQRTATKALHVCRTEAGNEIDMKVYPILLEYLERPDRPQVAYVAIPHNTYSQVVPSLLTAGVNFLKEKPMAMNLSEALEF
ncbi:MAG: hypothetical protein M1816_003100 [Peltula sp. TS41687]|nr:MAG: hypothetical protein M1816_003100 [Peltula sp. TS41687]